MTTAGEIMTPDPQCIGVNDSLLIAASLMADLDVGVLPICGEKHNVRRLPVMAERMLVGIISQGDIVRALALQAARPVPSISL